MILIKNNSRFRYILRAAIQTLFFSLFIVLVLNGLTQFWLLIFGIGVLASIVFSRFYCGWICPIGALARPIGWVYSKLGRTRRKTPSLLSKGWGRWIALIALISSIIYIRTAGTQLPVFLIITLIGVGFFLIFEEETFHKNICPYGAILSLSSNYAKYGLKVDKSSCIGCGKCQEVCPNNTISTLDSGAREIKNKECLVCFRCEEVCPVDSIEYRNMGGVQ